MSESAFRLTIFLSFLLILALLEIIVPRRKLVQSKLKRWATNFSMSVINTIVINLMGAVTAIFAANYALNHGWGLLAKYPLPLWQDLLIGFLLLDLAIYLQHRLSHKIPFLWRMHKVHHTDRDIDVTTAIRFHPLEIILSMLYKILVVIALGALPLTVLWFEIVLSASALFNHSNIRLPLMADRCLRWLIVTPDMHLVHHSTIQRETDSNYGFFLSLWDRIFRSYKDQPDQGHDNMIIGLGNEQHASTSRLWWGLVLPFKSK